MGYSPSGRKESDTTERLHFTSLHFTSLLSQALRLNSFFLLISALDG